MAESASGQDEANPTFCYPSGQDGSILPSSLFGHIINLLLTETSSWSRENQKRT